MADDYRRIEHTTGKVRRRHWTTEQKLQIIEESFLPGETVSSVARRRGLAPNLLYRWRRLLEEGERLRWDRTNLWSEKNGPDVSIAPG
jgi:transposase